jgi:hypothetical protein
MVIKVGRAVVEVVKGRDCDLERDEREDLKWAGRDICRENVVAAEWKVAFKADEATSVDNNEGEEKVEVEVKE